MSKFKPSRGTLLEGFSRPKSRRTSIVAAQSAPFAGSAAAVAEPEAASAEGIASLDAGPPNPTKRLAFQCTLLFLFFRFSFIHEFITSMLHFDTHILIILGVICYGAWLVSGGLFVAFSERLAWLWLAFVGCLCLATLTSSWKGGSVAIVLPYIRTTLPLLMLIPAVAGSREDLRKMLNTIGIAGIATTLFGLVHRSYTLGRMDIGSEGSSIQDPNDYAAHLIFLLPAIAYVVFAKQRPMVVKLFGVGIFGAALLEIVSTGSRGGLVTLLVTALYGLYKSPAKVRLLLVVGAPLLALVAIPLAPKEATTRLMSLFDSKEATESAAASTEARRALLMASLEATAAHPVTGVGPGTFMEFQADMASQAGQKGMWHETHNGYTQISSECGIPALLLYLAAIFTSFKMLRQDARSGFPDIAIMANTLAVMIVAFSTSLIFLAQGYRFTMLVTGSIVIAISLVLRQEKGGERVPQGLQPA